MCAMAHEYDLVTHRHFQLPRRGQCALWPMNMILLLIGTPNSPEGDNVRYGLMNMIVLLSIGTPNSPEGDNVHYGPMNMILLLIGTPNSPEGDNVRYGP